MAVNIFSMYLFPVSFTLISVLKKSHYKSYLKIAVSYRRYRTNKLIYVQYKVILKKNRI